MTTITSEAHSIPLNSDFWADFIARIGAWLDEKAPAKPAHVAPTPAEARIANLAARRFWRDALMLESCQ